MAFIYNARVNFGATCHCLSLSLALNAVLFRFGATSPRQTLTAMNQTKNGFKHLILLTGKGHMVIIKNFPGPNENGMRVRFLSGSRAKWTEILKALINK